MNGCVNFPLFSTIPNKQGAHCNSSDHLTQIELSWDWRVLGKPITTRPARLLDAVCLTHETGKQDNGKDLISITLNLGQNMLDHPDNYCFSGNRSITVNDEILSKEQRILRVLRKVLANIVKDATPAPGMPHPLKESTIYDIRDLFGLISEREAELADQSKPGRNEKPSYTDEPKKSNIIKLHKPGKKKDPGDE